ncbi:MAG: DUF2760 domain-containing protein [Alphaproteobacteria bacterium]|nr:DUF2760 domain-containing protein [Alphaproteobacteria bacterium]MBF0128468.1 DUF2760 domain-containing protein [Alphaproteobacteria bacterium]
MRILTVAAAFVLLVLAVVAVAPGAVPAFSMPDAVRVALPKVIAGMAALLFLAVLAERVKGRPAPAAEAGAALEENRCDAEVVSFLALLQEKGRLVDFLMDDVAGYGDAQVGAAARVLHEGCRAVLSEHFSIRPVRDEKEGSAVTVPVGHAPDDYRLVGRISGEPPFSGTLVHHGWRTDRVKLPRLLRTGGDLPAIAPAEVELG